MKKYWFQVLGLTSWSFLCLVPILKRGTNIVTNTFTEGTLRFWSGESPYDPSKVADVFHYSPLFAFLYRPFTELSGPAHALLWGFLNVLIFWMGVSVWVELKRGTSKWIWLALGFCAIELDISQRYQQMNALLVGVVLLSLHFYKKDRFLLSAVLISFITNLKLLPIVFLGLMCWPMKRKFLIPLLGFSLLWILIPALGVGLSRDIELHTLQLQAILSDTHAAHGGRPMLDFLSTLTRMGFGEAARVLNPLTAFTVLVLSLLMRLYYQKISLGLFYSFVMISLLVLSPRSESPTFVFLAPAYLFLVEELKGFNRSWVLPLGFFISFVFTDVWRPHFTWTYHQQYYCKVVGTYFFWVVLTGLVVKKLAGRKSVSPYATGVAYGH